MSPSIFLSGGDQPGVRDVACHPFPGNAIPARVRLTQDGQALTYLHSASGDMNYSLWRRELASGDSRALFDVSERPSSQAEESLEEALLKERLRQRSSGITTYQRLGNEPWLLFTFKRNLYLVHDESGESRPLTEGDSPCLDPKPSPDGELVAFVRDGELWTVPSAGGESKQLSAGDSDSTRGVADYIAQEEMDRSSGYFWSPDGAHIALFEVSEEHIPEYPIVHQGKDDVLIERHRYPFTGAENPRLRLGVIAREGGEIRFFDFPDEQEIYIPRVHWFDAKTIAVQVQNRAQTWLELRSIDIESGEQSLVLREDQPDAWINLHDGFKTLKAGESFLWLSERTGFQHAYLYTRDGQSCKALTSGEWMITKLGSVDEDAGFVYFTATKESPLERHLYRVSLEDPGEPEQITKTPGWHNVSLNLKTGHWLDHVASEQHPPKILLNSFEGGEPTLLFDAGEGDARAEALPRPELMEFDNRDGVRLYGALFRARTGDGRRPLIVHVYGGPHAQRVHRSWSLTIDMRAQYWTTLGFHVLRLDNRGSANRGLAFETPLRHETGIIEVQDQVDGVRALIAGGEVDPARVGIYGWSYGGYMTLMSLSRAPETFKAGVSGAPVTHWDGYDTHYTERYMGLLPDNPEGYEKSAALAEVENLQGKLLLIHGMLDENVHFRHTARYINALIQADKDYELLVFPDERHMPRNERGRLHMERRIAEFFQRHLGSDSPISSS